MKGRFNFDFIIVGQGLAGTCLSHTLESRFRKKVFVIDRDGGKFCSAIAAGTYNPIVFKNFSPVWRAREITPFLYKYYGELSVRLGVDLINEQILYKTLKGTEQHKLWVKKSAEFPSSLFMEEIITDSVEGVSGQDGFGKIKNTGNIKIKELLEGYRRILINENRILEEELDFKLLHFSDDEVSYKNISAQSIIFCQGYENGKNPFFRKIPFKETKGEVLIIRAEGWNPPGIVSNNINIVPLGHHKFWVGSTFDWDDLTTEVTEGGKRKLLEQLRETIQVEFEVIDHKAGIRPTVKDRRPVLGRHPEYKNILIFNGMGTRGVMLAPYFSMKMAQYIEEDLDLEKEVNIKRFSELM